MYPNFPIQPSKPIPILNQGRREADQYEPAQTIEEIYGFPASPKKVYAGVYHDFFRTKICPNVEKVTSSFSKGNESFWSGSCFYGCLLGKIEQKM